MDADPPVNYATGLHDCWVCGETLRLRTYPVNGGWVLGTGCGGCRDRTGLPARYSTDSEVLTDFHHADNLRRDLLTGVAA